MKTEAIKALIEDVSGYVNTPYFKYVEDARAELAAIESEVGDLAKRAHVLWLLAVPACDGPISDKYSEALRKACASLEVALAPFAEAKTT